MSDTTKPGDPADRAADGAFGGVTSHRVGYGDKLARLERWLRRYPTATLGSGEGAVLLVEIDRLRAELEREQMRLAACGVVAMANTPDTAAKARDILPDYQSASFHGVTHIVDENMKLRADIERVRALHQRKIACVGWSHEPICAECKYANGERADYPCSTIKALDGGDA